jgi:hypothetical protein
MHLIEVLDLIVDGTFNVTLLGQDLGGVCGDVRHGAAPEKGFPGSLHGDSAAPRQWLVLERL